MKSKNEKNIQFNYLTFSISSNDQYYFITNIQATFPPWGLGINRLMSENEVTKATAAIIIISPLSLQLKEFEELTTRNARH